MRFETRQKRRDCVEPGHHLRGAASGQRLREGGGASDFSRMKNHDGPLWGILHIYIMALGRKIKA